MGMASGLYQSDCRLRFGFTDMAAHKTTFPVLRQGLGKTCMYCGDGINDLSALGAADVGMAIGSTDASAAAAISCKQASIGGGLLFFRHTLTPNIQHAIWRLVEH